MHRGLPAKQGMYNPANEKDSCGIGFVANIKGEKTHNIIVRALEVLVNMTHRGAESADNKSGDGAGILTQMPHELYLSKGVKLPEPGEYGTGLVFLPQNAQERKKCEQILMDSLIAENLKVVDLIDVPVNSSVLGEIAKHSEPFIRQIFVVGDYELDDLERKLYIARKQAELKVRQSDMKQKSMFYLPSLSPKVVVYKGMFTPEQLGGYYLDLTNPLFTSALGLIHSRFSTNTFPTWDLAQPFRYVAHNGEINTIKGNRMWMGAREPIMKTSLLGGDLKKLYPIIEPGKSDSASFDNALEFLTLTGKTLPHALSMMIPESFNDKNPIPNALKAFYEYHSTIMEPWDGPASMVFSNGRYIGGTLDRNGLRPSRYLITKDDMIVMGSETGVQSFEGSQIKEKGRLRPGKILLVDTKLGVIVPDEMIKRELTKQNPYPNWLKENRIDLEDIVVKKRVPSTMADLPVFRTVFNYSREDVDEIIAPMAMTGQEPTGSMGNDTPIAVMSNKPVRLFGYFKQLFAQVTNPAIDPIREGLVMTLANYIGSVKKNLLVEEPDICKLIRFQSPVITNTDLGKIKGLEKEGFRHQTIDMLFDAKEGQEPIQTALDKLCAAAEQAVNDGINYIILSDRGLNAKRAPIPSLLATAAVHHHLIKTKKRMQVGLVVETGEAREVHHFALLLGYGASVINPYVSYAVIDDLVKRGELKMEYGKARENYIKAIDKGLLKIFSKMGISTLRSYHGAEIFEAIGISKKVTEKYFTQTESRIGGVGLSEIAKETLMPHHKAYEKTNQPQFRLPSEGVYSFRVKGEGHAWNPETVGLLQWAARTNSYEKYKEYSAEVEAFNRAPHCLRGCFDLKPGTKKVNLKDVESAEKIMKRFVTGAMSYGSISKEAHEALAIAMNTVGGRSNTGEGGEDAERFAIGADGLNRRSSIKQVASGRFGVTINYLVNADEIQIKVCQGAKPGEGGQLPGHKVNQIIARLRNSTPGITLISPPPHHDIYSIEDLAQLIFDLKCANPDARISVKLVAENGVGTVAAGVAKAYSDNITISGGDGGTGASPVSSIKHAGLPVEMGIAETQQTLVLNDLRDRVKLQADGQMKNGIDVVKLALLGAEEFGFSTSALITLGCIMMRKCHLNTCPVGVATQDPAMRARFIGKAEFAVNYFRFVAEEIRETLAYLGFKKFEDIVGRTDLLVKRKDIDHWKAKLVNLDLLTYAPPESKKNALYCKREQRHKISGIMDHELISLSEPAFTSQQKVWISKTIKNTDRTVGTMLSGKISKLQGEAGLPEDTINCKFRGSAGQSFGAFLAKGVSFLLEGDSNDYLGKGLSGGRIVVIPPAEATFKPEENIIIGNTVLYGATGGQAYIKGVAGERFCVRNSGAYAVVEGVGDHGCEYMTGGRTVVLGRTGRNFAAGMSGGIAYVLDVNGDFDYYCNKGMVEVNSVGDAEDIQELQRMISDHMNYTNSALAEKILVNWADYLPKFKKVIPLEYKRVMEQEKLRKIEEQLKKTEDEPHYQY